MVYAISKTFQTLPHQLIDSKLGDFEFDLAVYNIGMEQEQLEASKRQLELEAKHGR